MATQTASNKRRRIALACNACRTRKSRCDGHRPSCATCISLNLECEYEPSDSSTNVIVRKDYMTDLDRRMAAMERTTQRLDNVLKGHLSACTPAGSSSISSSSVNATESSLPHGPALEEPREENTATDGMAMIFVEEHTSAFFGESSNIHFTRLLLRIRVAMRRSAADGGAAAAQDPTLLENNIASFTKQRPYSPATPSDFVGSPMTSLPSAKEMHAMIDTYFDTTGILFPFIHEATTRKTFAEFEENGFTKVRRIWLGMLNMIFAMALNFDRDGTTPVKDRLEKSNVFYKRAVGLCGELSKRVLSLEIVHHLLLVVLYCQGTQQSIQAWNVHGLLVRSAMALGLHVDRTGRSLDQFEEESRCRTWLTIYCLDKVLSMTFGRPCAIADDNIDSRRPLPWPTSPTVNALQKETDLTPEFLALSFQLYQLVGHSLNKQYGANMGRRDLELDDMALLQSSGEFRKVLRLWASNLPPHLHLCEPQSRALTQSSRLNRLRVILSLRYYNVGILIHRPLLGATLRSMFGHAHSQGPTAAYLVQLAMAEAHECISSAESTLDIVYMVLTADRTSKNNLGVWFFSLYYVFTASLVICSRLLWAQYGQAVPDDTAVTRAKLYLEKAETIYQRLDSGNTLVSCCGRFIRQLAGLQLPQGPAANHDSSGLPSSSTDASSDRTSTSVLQPLEMMGLNPEDSETFQLFASEIFDPSIFEGFEPTTDGRNLENGMWEDFAAAN